MTLFGADPRIVRLRGSLLQGFSADDAAGEQALVLPTTSRAGLGVRFGDRLRVQIAGRTVTAQVAVAGAARSGRWATRRSRSSPLTYLQTPDRRCADG